MNPPSMGSNEHMQGGTASHARPLVRDEEVSINCSGWGGRLDDGVTLPTLLHRPDERAAVITLYNRLHYFSHTHCEKYEGSGDKAHEAHCSALDVAKGLTWIAMSPDYYTKWMRETGLHYLINFVKKSFVLLMSCWWVSPLLGVYSISESFERLADAIRSDNGRPSATPNP